VVDRGGREITPPGKGPHPLTTLPLALLAAWPALMRSLPVSPLADATAG
jgi:hypothetical protein